MPPNCADAFRDVLQLIKAEYGTFEDFPCEIYYAALVWLPKSICAPLEREREMRSLPTIISGLPESWSSQAPLERKQLIVDSLFVIPGSSLVRWLSISDEEEVMVHEWDTIVDSETQHSMGRRAHKRVLSKMSTDGVFFFDPETNVLSFKHFSSPTQRQLYSEKLWHFENAGSLSTPNPTFELAVSVDGSYAALWDPHQPQVWLVNVHKRTCYNIPSNKLVSTLSTTDSFIPPTHNLFGSQSKKSSGLSLTSLSGSPSIKPFGSSTSVLGSLSTNPFASPSRTRKGSPVAGSWGPPPPIPDNFDLCFSSDGLRVAISHTCGHLK